jgi:broad specificity phosphatase PhoE
MQTLLILRHGEKPDGPKSSLELSSVGKQRAQFLAKNFIGRGDSSLFGNKGPDVFFSITPHTIETASPSAESWGLPVTAFCTVTEDDAKEAALDERTKEAAGEIARALQQGRDVVVVWEHHRIADARRGHQPTLRELLTLDAIRNVPETWCDKDFDTLWRFTRTGPEEPWQFEKLPQNFNGGEINEQCTNLT